jgi:hypothetical protein
MNTPGGVPIRDPRGIETSPNGVDHLVINGHCVTCGGDHREWNEPIWSIWILYDAAGEYLGRTQATDPEAAKLKWLRLYGEQAATASEHYQETDDGT